MTRPSIRELECFIAAADHLNFSRAARALHLSQPPLTRHIQALEEKLGSRLFERNTHSVSLTVSGQLFLEDARLVLGQLDRAVEATKRSGDGETLRLRLAFVGALLDEKLVHLIQLFRKTHPTCQIQITDLAPAAQLTAIKTGEIDGGFIGAQPNLTLKDISFIVWSKEPLLLALPHNHPLARVPSLRWKDLVDYPWVMVSRSAAPAFRQQFAELSEKYRLTGRIVHESERVPAILTMVAAGNGITLIPQSVRHLLTKGICFRKLPVPEPILHHTFAYQNNCASYPLKAFLALL